MNPCYIIVHTTHEGCQNCCSNEEESTIPVRINTPKIFFFIDKDKAQDFFNEYIYNVNNLDPRCSCDNGNDIKHVENCLCGTVEMDEENNPILFCDKKNQVFFLENTGQIFTPQTDIKTTINGSNIIHKIITKKCKNLGYVQREEYIKIGQMCEDYKKELLARMMLQKQNEEDK